MTIAGRNVDVVRYRARVRASRVDLAAMQIMEMRHPIDICFEWLDDLARAS